MSQRLFYECRLCGKTFYDDREDDWEHINFQQVINTKTILRKVHKCNEFRYGVGELVGCSKMD